MTVTILRGRFLSFLTCPQSDEDESSYDYIEDGAIALIDGLIAWRGTYSEAIAKFETFDIVDHRPNLIMPGFIDTHTHFPQSQVIASHGETLLDWLNTYTFTEELKCADAKHSRSMSGWFLDELIRNGTTTASVYCTVHSNSVDAIFEAAEQRGMCLIAGKVLMDRNAPDALCEPAQISHELTIKHIKRWHKKDRLSYAISPRFAITSSSEQLALVQALMHDHPSCYLQTHMSETHEEGQLTKQLFPEARNYVDVYDSYGLLGPRSLLGHCVHLNGSEQSRLAETGSVAVFCPTSNLFLGSGLFDMQGLEHAKVRVAIATDIGAGTSYSMLRTIADAYKICQLQGQKFGILSAFHMLTRGNALALGLDASIGTLEPGSYADIVVLDSRATPAMAHRMETVEHLTQELFVLQTLGDDRAISTVYVAGKNMTPLPV